jgi:hypothetical protein
MYSFYSTYTQTVLNNNCRNALEYYYLYFLIYYNIKYSVIIVFSKLLWEWYIDNLQIIWQQKS